MQQANQENPVGQAAALTVQGLRKSYGDKTILQDVSFQASAGEFIVLVGPSGCGKSTMLRSIAGLEFVDQGDISIGQRKVTHQPPKDRNIAMVFQDYALYPHKTVYENIAFGLRVRKHSEADVDKRVREAAAKLNLERLLERRPAALSGGQRQRVAIGRAIVRKPELFLFDEPLSNLDAKLRGTMRIEIAKLHKELEATIVYVTHDQVEAMTLADRIVVLDGGKIQQIGRPLDLYYRPQNVFVASFIGSPQMNLLRGTLRREGSQVHVVLQGGLECRLPDALASQVSDDVSDGSAVIWGLRPEDVAPLAQGVTGASLLSVKVAVTEIIGPTTSSICRIQGGAEQEIVVSIHAPLRPAIGDAFELTCVAEQLYLFDEKNGESLVKSVV